MRDPYLYEDVDVLRNRANIKDYELLRKAEADITNLAMTAIYEREYAKFNTETLCDIHRTIFGQIYEWGGEFRTIQMTKSEVVLGGDTVHYAYPKEIKKKLTEIMKEITKYCYELFIAILPFGNSFLCLSPLEFFRWHISVENTLQPNDVRDVHF